MTDAPLTPPWTPPPDNESGLEHSKETEKTEIDPTNIPLPDTASRRDDLHRVRTAHSAVAREKGITKVEQAPEAVAIPLPPSPSPLPINSASTTKQSLPLRRPGFVGSAPLRRVSSTTRTVSGRRVSGALQYALHPHPEIDPTEVTVPIPESESATDLRNYEEMKQQLEIESDNDGPEVEGQGEGEDTAGVEERGWDSSLGFGGVIPDTMISDEVDVEEEAWMGYVRQQLNTLFPDLFHPDPLMDHPSESDHDNAHDTPELEEGGEGEGETSISTIATNELPTPPISGSLTRFGSRSGFGFGLGSGPDTHGLGGIAGVPNVRHELGGLREEIERLRGVVSGLAEGMRAQPTSTTTITDIPTSTLDSQVGEGSGVEQAGEVGEAMSRESGGMGGDDQSEMSAFQRVSHDRLNSLD